MSTDAAGTVDWAEDDSRMEQLNLERWGHRLGHECGHATAAMHFKHYPDEILLGKIVQINEGRSQEVVTHHGMARNVSLPDDAPAEDKVVVMLAGVEAEKLLFGRQDEGGKRDHEQAAPFIEEIRSRPGETRTSEQILGDLRKRTKEVLGEHEAVLRRLFEKGMARAVAFPLLELNLKHMKVFEKRELHDLFHKRDKE